MIAVLIKIADQIHKPCKESTSLQSMQELLFLYNKVYEPLPLDAKATLIDSMKLIQNKYDELCL